MRKYEEVSQAGPLLLAVGLSFAYAGCQPLFSGLDISLDRGETVVLTGSSGCGKSTLCQILAYIIPRNIRGVLQGNIFLEGHELGSLPLARLAQTLAMVREEPKSQLFAPTVEDELAFGPENLRLPPEIIRIRVDEALALTALEQYRLSAPHQLSGGQKQLVALGAALTLKPKLLILDEIFCHLDETAIRRVENLIKGLNRQNVAVLLICHDRRYWNLAHRVLRLEAGFLEEVIA
ncbi:MAG: energy-coupling factor ABC transporter ATP-binding protein [Clostridiales bacterium]|nr:energy-coupling factor ABC transporter ATP-binding protein [Clostridiales bacterium]